MTTRSLKPILFGVPGEFSYNFVIPCPLRPPNKYRNMFHPKICLLVVSNKFGKLKKSSQNLLKGKFGGQNHFLMVSVRFMFPIHWFTTSRPMLSCWSFSTRQSTTGTRWWILVTHDAIHWHDGTQKKGCWSNGTPPLHLGFNGTPTHFFMGNPSLVDCDLLHGGLIPIPHVEDPHREQHSIASHPWTNIAP